MADKMKCPHCGKLLSKEATHCPHCGEAVDKKKQKEKDLLSGYV